MKKSLLVTLADEHQIDQAKQLFSSVYWNSGWKGDYMLLAYGIPEKKLRWFRKKGILIKKCRPIFRNENRFRSIVTCKFYMFVLEFKKWQNVVFLDSDIIVRASLDELAKVKGFAAVEEKILADQFISFSGSEQDNVLLRNLKENYDLGEMRFNAGVVAFNTKIINKKVFPELKILFNFYKRINLLNDQSILNLVFYKKWQRLPLCYNVSPYLLAHPFFIRNIKKIPGIILHFMSKRKPWDKGDPFNKEWRRNLEIAEFIDVNKPVPARDFDKKAIMKISRRVKIKMLTYTPVRIMDRWAGLFGLVLKERCPKIYEKLKRLAN